MSTVMLTSFCKTVQKECYFSKVRFLDRWLASVFETAFKDLRITPNQFNLLVAIHSMGDFASAKMLTKHLKIEKSTASRDLRILRSKGFVKEKIQEKDKRNKGIILTSSGKSAISSCRKAWTEAQKKAGDILNQTAITRYTEFLDSKF